VDAREVPVGAGSFGLEDNIAYIIDCLRLLGSELHVVALCQSAMPALAATALLASDRPAEAPRTLTLLSGMIDPRIAPTRIDRWLASHSLRWFEQNAVEPVPAPYPGEGRLVYPAMMQHASLLAYLIRHLGTGEELLGKVLHDDGADPARHPFLQSFLSVMDLPAPFLLDWIRLAFHEFALPRGRLTWRGAKVTPSAMTQTALMTVEGERDDVSAPGQTRIAHELCTGVPDRKRVHHLQSGVGHFGTFHGHVWRTKIMPQIRAFIRTAASAASSPA
jgi:poly(3-hydroxybutyrate) depolymerase